MAEIDREGQLAVGRRRSRKPYRRPRILSRERLEFVAGICTPSGKADPGSCPTGPITS